MIGGLCVKMSAELKKQIVAQMSVGWRSGELFVKTSVDHPKNVVLLNETQMIAGGSEIFKKSGEMSAEMSVESTKASADHPKNAAQMSAVMSQTNKSGELSAKMSVELMKASVDLPRNAAQLSVGWMNGEMSVKTNAAQLSVESMRPSAAQMSAGGSQIFKKTGELFAKTSAELKTVKKNGDLSAEMNVGYTIIQITFLNYYLI